MIWWYWFLLKKDLWKAENLASHWGLAPKNGPGPALQEAVNEAKKILAVRDRHRYREASKNLHHRYQAVTKSSKILLFLEYVEAFAVALVLALFIRAEVVQAFQIPSGSMLPTLQIGDHILANKFIYNFEDVDRGDIVVFQFPDNKDQDFIKRVIGLPGETVEIRDRTVFINGKPLEEDYTIYENIPARQKFGPETIKPGVYFVMGDNRDKSYDSRYWGCVPEKDIRGKAMIIYWSWNKEEDLLHKIRWSRFAKIVR